MCESGFCCEHVRKCSGMIEVDENIGDQLNYKTEPDRDHDGLEDELQQKLE